MTEAMRTDSDPKLTTALIQASRERSRLGPASVASAGALIRLVS